MSAASGGESNWSIIEKMLSQRSDYGATLLRPRANPSVLDRINSVNGLLASFEEQQSEAYTVST